MKICLGGDPVFTEIQLFTHLLIFTNLGRRNTSKKVCSNFWGVYFFLLCEEIKANINRGEAWLITIHIHPKRGVKGGCGIVDGDILVNCCSVWSMIPVGPALSSIPSLIHFIASICEVTQGHSIRPWCGESLSPYLRETGCRQIESTPCSCELQG